MLATKENPQTKPQGIPEGIPEDEKNKDFVMLYRKFISDVADLAMSDATALRVLMFLVRNMDYTNAIAVPMTLVADMLKLTRQTVSQKIKYLHKEGWIDILKLGKQNVYVVNPEFVWSSYAGQKAYCKFNATCMLSKGDNLDVSRNQKQRVKYLGPLKEMAEKYDE